MSARPCGTCTKPVYPKEKTAISDIWVHAGCLKCSVCTSTLGLKSTYVGIDAQGDKKLFCKTDVPRTVYTSVVDSIALRRALNAPKVNQLQGGGRLGGAKMGSMRFKGLTLRSKSVAGGLNAPKIRGDGSRNKIVIGTVKGVSLDSWDIATALETQSNVSSPAADFPALAAQLTGSTQSSFPSPSILVPQQTGTSHTDEVDAGDDDGIAREKKGQKENMPIGAGLVKNLLRAFQLEEVREVNLPANHVRAPTPFAMPETPVAAPSPLGADDGRFMSIKPSSFNVATDLIDVRTLGTRRQTETTQRKPALKSLFDPPSTSTDKPAQSPQKHVKISSGEPSLISLFANGDVLPPLPDSPGDESSYADENEDDEGEGTMGHQEMVNALDEAGLEVVMVYEEEPSTFVDDARVEL